MLTEPENLLGSCWDSDDGSPDGGLMETFIAV